MTKAGYALVAQRGRQTDFVLEMGLTEGADQCRLDKSGSVSALVEGEGHWVPELLDQQYRRFLNGS